MNKIKYVILLLMLCSFSFSCAPIELKTPQLYKATIYSSTGEQKVGTIPPLTAPYVIITNEHGYKYIYLDYNEFISYGPNTKNVQLIRRLNDKVVSIAAYNDFWSSIILVKE